MKHATRKTWFLVVVALVCLATPCFGLDSLTLTGTNGNYVMGNVYTSPYSISVNGTPMLLICDDFLTDINIGDTWNASTANLTSLPDLQAMSGGNPTAAVKFDKSQTGSAAAQQQINDYSAAAYLAYELMSTPAAMQNNYANEIAGEISYAIWGVFDAQLLNSTYQAGLAGNAVGKLTSTELAAANSYLAAARAAVGPNPNLSALPNVNIYTPQPNGKSQEFLGFSPGYTYVAQMAEAPAPALLAFDLLALLGATLVFRRRKGRTF